MEGTACNRADTSPSSADGTASFSSTSTGAIRWETLRLTIVIALAVRSGVQRWGLGSRMYEGPGTWRRRAPPLSPQPARDQRPDQGGGSCRSGLSGADALLDPVAQVRVDVAPVLEG